MNNFPLYRFFQFGFVVFFATFIAPVSYSAPDPEICNETGPHTNTVCMEAGSYNSPVRLTWTNMIVQLGSSVSPPSLVGTVFNQGKTGAWVYYDCSWNTYQNHYISTNTETYQTNILFTPSFPTTASTLGTNSYTMRVLGSSSVCGSLAYLYFGVKLVVWGTGDSDYDGINDFQEATNGTDPKNPASINPVRLGYWPFDNTNTWVGSAGQLPLSGTNVFGVPSWSTNGGFSVTNDLALLKYRDAETNGSANINLRSGSVRLWFKPNWASQNLGGTGPQSEGRLIELGDKGTTNGWWALLLNATGTNVYFCTQTNASSTLRTNLSAAFSWSSNEWHQVVLAYGATNSSLYLDGQPVVTNGIGVTNYPGLTARSLGFTIGSSASGTNQAKGTFDELETFNYALSATNIYANYQSAITLDSDGDGLSNIIENQRGLNPYSYNSLHGLSNSNVLQVFTPLK